MRSTIPLLFSMLLPLTAWAETCLSEEQATQSIRHKYGERLHFMAIYGLQGYEDQLPSVHSSMFHLYVHPSRRTWTWMQGEVRTYALGTGQRSKQECWYMITAGRSWSIPNKPISRQFSEVLTDNRHCLPLHKRFAGLDTEQDLILSFNGTTSNGNSFLLLTQGEQWRSATLVWHPSGVRTPAQKFERERFPCTQSGDGGYWSSWVPLREARIGL